MASLGLTLGRIARIVRGTLMGYADLVVDQVFIDSRQKVSNGLFVALKGERFDGHDFATQAAANGARAVLVSKQIDGLMAPHILVGDTLRALHALAGWKRREFGGAVAAITGSSGKTTTRRMLHAILATRGPVHQPARNFNNHIGVPLTLLGLDAAHGAAVLELGCSDFGEIAPLTALVDPDVGLVTNVGPAHLEKLGSLDGVARAKGELFATMREDAVAVVNGDDPRVAAMPCRPGRRVVFGTAEGAAVRLLGREFAEPDGQIVTLAVSGERIDVPTRFVGAHNAANVTAAAAAASALGLDAGAVIAGLGRVGPEPGRLALLRGKNGLRIIDDTYNANPASVKAALETLRETRGEGRTIAVLGDMLELGAASEAAHLDVGRSVAASGVDMLITLGLRAERIRKGALGNSAVRGFAAANHDEAADRVLDIAEAGDTVLVKGSRGMAMEQVVMRLTEERP
jgi:UDP-N-acetylmuramoyl-tripeptide--D-alanyl-D-alanine ligase